MGSFNCADVVTGETIQTGDRVVAFLIHQKPDDIALKDNPNQAACKALDRFKLVSLPMYGVYDDFGSFEASAPQGIAMRLAELMTGLKGSKSICENATGFRSQVQLLGRANHEPRFGSDGNYTRTYGLAYLHESTYQHLVQLCGGAELDAEVEAVFALLEFADKALEKAQRNGFFEQSKTRNHLFSLSEACSLKDKRTYLDEDLKPVDAPKLSHGLSSSTFHDDFFETVSALGLDNLMYKDPRKPEDGDGPYRKWLALREYLSLLWETRCLVYGLDRVGAEMRPSRTVGQRKAGSDVLMLQLTSAIELRKRTLKGMRKGKERDALQATLNALHEAKNTLAVSVD